MKNYKYELIMNNRHSLRFMTIFNLYTCVHLSKHVLIKNNTMISNIVTNTYKYKYVF